MKRLRPYIFITMTLLLLLVNLTACDTFKISDTQSLTSNTYEEPVVSTTSTVDLNNIPEYDGSSAYVVINNNMPYFEESDFKEESFEFSKSLLLN